MSPDFSHTDLLDFGVRRISRYATQRGELKAYSVTLTVFWSGRWQTVRVYDNTHGTNEMHRHTLSGGKQAGAPFHNGTASEAYNEARAAVKHRYKEMIAGWLR